MFCKARLSAALWLLAMPTPAAPPPVSVGTLLRQETDLAQMPRFRDWTDELQSSYDRAGGNGDAQNFIRVDGTTATLFDRDGPGAVVRLWSANPNGQIKVYIDGSLTPVISAPFAKLFDGSLPPFAAPLAQPSSGGFYSYLPIPFTRHCRITVDDPRGLYYQVNSITFPAGTPVRSFALPLAPEDQNAVTAADAALSAPAPAPLAPARTLTLAPGQAKEIARYAGPGTVREVQVRLTGADALATRRLVLRAYFDGHKTPDIQSPVADFFGDAYGPAPFMSLLLSQSPDGAMTARFPMPFGRAARFTLENGADTPVIVAWAAQVEKRAFQPRQEGYFHAWWARETTRRGAPHVWARVRGQRGHLVGIVQSMAGRSLGFLEGDDQVRVDGQIWLSSKVPTTVIGPWNGTGTEDFFNSGWYFLGTIPHALPLNGVLVRDDAGRINAYRWFLDDAPVFGSSLDAQIEHGGANDAPGTDYASVAYWYSSGPVQPWTQMSPARDITLPQAPPRPAVPGAIEGESLAPTAKASGGTVRTQDTTGYAGTWSGDAQLWWVGARAGDTLTLPLTPPSAGTYALTGYFTQAPDYGRFTFGINGQTLGREFDAYAPTVRPSGAVALGRVALPAGPSHFTVTVRDPNPASAGTLFGLDALVLKPAR